MFAERAIGLVKELNQNPGTLPPYNMELANEVSKEIVHLIEQNQEDARANEESRTSSSSSSESSISFIPTIRVRHAAIQRNLRCLMAYHYNRLRLLRTMRWEFGSLLPSDVKANLSPAEVMWFSKYSSALAKYMRSVGEDGGINLAMDLHPPKALYIEVKCLVDYGRYEFSNGSVILLKKNSRHFLPRVECEELIRQGVFEHIVS